MPGFWYTFRLAFTSSIDVFIGKGLLTLISIFVTGFILMLITANGFANLDVIIVSTLASSIFAILVGMTVGLLSPNQMATGIVGTPIYLVCYF